MKKERGRRPRSLDDPWNKEDPIDPIDLRLFGGRNALGRLDAVHFLVPFGAFHLLCAACRFSSLRAVRFRDAFSRRYTTGFFAIRRAVRFRGAFRRRYTTGFLAIRRAVRLHVRFFTCLTGSTVRSRNDRDGQERSHSKNRQNSTPIFHHLPFRLTELSNPIYTG